MTSPATISDAALNRTVLARQLLLGRRRLAVPRALERVAGLQNQYAPTSYIGLWSRIGGFERHALTRALERGTVVQGTLMRATIHVVSSRDYPAMADALRHVRRDWWLRVSRPRGLDVDYDEMAKEVDRVLSEGPLRRSELVERLEAAGFPREGFEGVGMWVDMVRVPPSGTWERRRADLYQTAERWIGYRPGPAGAGLTHLIRRYLGAFGPASPADVASWAGCPIVTVTSHLAEMELRRFLGEDGSELLDLPRLQVVAGDTPAPVRFLGPWEALLLVHARRSGVLDEEFRPLVFNTKNPHSVGTFLVDGRAAGAWRWDDGRVHLEPFAPIPRGFRRDLAEEADALCGFLA